MNILCFDIETIPDVRGLRTLYATESSCDLTTLSDAELVAYVQQQRRVANGSDFMPLHCQRVVAISCLLRFENKIKVWSLAEPSLSEAEIIQRFYDGIEKYSPQLISWNGGGFDLPVLHYRGLIHGVSAPYYWNTGDSKREIPSANQDKIDKDFRYNNYINRYHLRHTDLMDLLSLYQLRASVKLDDLAKLIGFPGKQGMDGSQVWDAWQDGKIKEISDYCETDVANTFLVFTRFRRMRGEISAQTEASEFDILRQNLEKANLAHWNKFLAGWSNL